MLLIWESKLCNCWLPSEIRCLIIDYWAKRGTYRELEYNKNIKIT